MRLRFNGREVIPRCSLRTRDLKASSARSASREMTNSIARGIVPSFPATTTPDPPSSSSSFQTEQTRKRGLQLQRIIQACNTCIRIRNITPSSVFRRHLYFMNVVIGYGKPNGAKFKNQNWLHIQQVFYQGQGRFQSSSTKSSHVQRIFSQGQDTILSKLNKMKLSHSTNFPSRPRDV